MCRFPSPASPPAVTTARSALQETFLYQERFINFLNGTGVFSQSSSNGGQTHRSSFEFIDNSTQNLVIYLIKTIAVYVQGLQRKPSYLHINPAGTFDLRKIPHTPKKCVGNTWSSTTARSNLTRRLYIARHIQYLCRTADNSSQHIIIVIFQMQVNAETCTKRRRKQSATSSRPHQSKRIQV